MSSTNGTTMSQTFDCTVTVGGPGRKLWTVISPGGTKTIPLNLDIIDNVAINDDEETIIRKLKIWGGMNVKFPYTFTRDELVILNELYKRTVNMPAPTSAPVIAPVEIHPPIVQTPAPVIAPPATTLSSLEHHTVTVETPAGPVQTKKRQRKTDPAIRTLYDAISSKTRRYGIDELEKRINNLSAVREWADGNVKSVNYEIPSVIRKDPGMIDPCAVFHAAGLIWRGGSHWIAKPSMIESEMFTTMMEIINRYGEGTPDAIRLGAHTEITIEGVAFEDIDQLKTAVSKSLSKLLIKAHTDLIVGLDEADKALAEALKGEKTSNEQVKERAARDNAYRAAIRAAHEELNVALTAAQNYDHDEKVVDLMKGLRAVVASRRNAFNAQQQLANLKGVEV